MYIAEYTFHYFELESASLFIGTFARQFYFSGSANGPAQNIPKCTLNVDRKTKITRCKSGSFPVISSFRFVISFRDFVVSSNTESLCMGPGYHWLCVSLSLPTL